MHGLRTLMWALVACLASPAAIADCVGRTGRDLPQQPVTGAGLSLRHLAAMNREIDAAGLDVRALLVVRDCTVVFERYGKDLGRENIHTLYSVSKSVTATLAGILMARGSLPSLDLPLASLIGRPSGTSSEDWKKAEQITLRHVLGMVSGLDTTHNPLGPDSLYSTATDRVFESLKPSLAAPAGTQYRYSDRNAALYGAALEGVAKTGLLNLAREALFGPLDFGRNEWLFRDRDGRYPGGWGIRLRPMDVAKLGQLYVQRGIWNGRTIVSPGYIDTVWTSGPYASYGLGWWIATRPEFQAVPLRYGDGVKGQRLYVFPRHQTVVVVLSSLTGPEERTMSGIVSQGTLQAISAGYTADPESERQLAGLAAAGFRGVTRVAQSDQDTPGR